MDARDVLNQIGNGPASNPALVRRPEHDLEGWQERARSAEWQAAQAAALETIPERYRWARFDALELRSRVRRAEAIKLCRDSLDSGSVLLVGGSGSGKTSLAAAMLRAVIDAGESQAARRRASGALFVGAMWVAKARSEHRLGDGEAPLIARAIGATVLVLDDLGAEQARNTALAEVIYERHAQDRPTIVTTWLTVQQAAERYGDGIARRLFEDAKVIRCDAGRSAC